MALTKVAKVKKDEGNSIRIVVWRSGSTKTLQGVLKCSPKTGKYYIVSDKK
jgi:hypothetical protein